MAEAIGAMYLRLGLNLSDLETGFVRASQTVAANISRLNRESQLIRIRSQVEIEGLDEVADAERIAQVRTNALNQQLAIQRDRVRILSTELQSVTQAHGANSVAAQRATIRLERERLALAQLEHELRNLNSTQDETNSAFGELNNLLPQMPTRLQAVGIAASAVASAIGFAAGSTREMIEDFRELQKQSYELNMSFNDTKNFLRELKLTGVEDIGDYEGFVRGISDAFVKGEYDDPEFIALRKYGAEITDVTGRLKDFKDITEEVYQAWLKADAAGEGIEFLQLTGGEAGIRDAIQYFQRLKEAREDAAKIYDANLDASQLHELDRALLLVDEQARELKNSIGNIFVPAAQAGAEKFFNLIHDGTEWLVENKDELQRWGFIVKEIFDEIAPKINNLLPSGQIQTVLESFDKIFSKLNGSNEELGNGFLDSVGKFFGDNFFSEAINRAEEKQREFNKELDETAEKIDEIDEKEINPLSQYAVQRVQQFKDELEDLKIELSIDDTDYEKKLAQLDLWRERELEQKLYVSAEERLAIEELYAAKSEQIEQERADKLAEIREGIAAVEKTELEKRVDDIEREKESWIQAGMDKAEAQQLAESQLSSYISEVNQSLSEEINSLRQNDLERRLSQIEQEKQAWLNKGADEALAEQQAQEKIRQAHQETEAKLNQIREGVAALDKSDLENKIAAIRREKEEWIQAGMDKAETEQLAQKKINHVLQDEAKQRAEAEKQYQEQVEQAWEDYYKKIEAAAEEAKRKNEAAFNEAFNVVKSEAKELEAFLKGGYEGLQKYLYGQLIKSGVKPEILETMTPETLDAYKDAKEEANRSFMPNWYDRYSPKYVEPPNVEKPLTATGQAADIAANSLVDLADAAGGAAEILDDNTFEEIPDDDRGGAVGAYQNPDGSISIENLHSNAKKNKPVNDYIIPEGQGDKYYPDIEAQEAPESLSEFPAAVQGITENLSELQAGAQGATESLNELPTAVQGVSESLEQMPELNFSDVISEIEQSFSQIPTLIQEALDFTGLNESFAEVSVKINDLGFALENFVSRLTDSSAAEQKTPVEVTNNISIEEAHAWDYSHIQELAERVAEILKPAIVSAVGGDDNAY